ncbi:MAG: hypothetical protein HPY82_15040 [Gammaproteobacteria bacterium]|nr:hypothetical protein [Gammaproteobacteria bacterium]
MHIYKNRECGFSRALSGVLGVCVLGAAQVSTAAETWEYSITPYFFAAAIDATVGVGNVETDVDLDASDVLENTESGFMAMMSARNGDWVVALDASYFQLKDGESSSVTGPFGRTAADGTVELTNRQWVYQPMVGQRVLDDTLKMDIYGGLRYTRLRANLDVAIDASLVRFPGDSSSFKSEKDWTDYVMGAHLDYAINQQWSLTGLVDWGMGRYSDLSYQFLAAVQWHFQPQMAASLGYRVLHQEYEEDRFSWDVTYSGLVLGLGFGF